MQKDYETFVEKLEIGIYEGYQGSEGKYFF